MMRRVLPSIPLVPLLPLALLFLLAAPSAHAQIGVVSGPQQSIYRLSAASTYQDGCFDPCACAVQLNGALIGAFRLTAAPPDPLHRIFNVTDLNWFVPAFGTWVTGSGTYTIGGEVALTQELSLDLKVDGRPVQHYDSGVVAGGADFPTIDITISMNNMVCRDTVFHVVAGPVSPLEIQPYSLFSSLYEEGCFGPCVCAVTAQAVDGRFGLLKIGGDSTVTDYAVVDVRWMVHDLATPTAITGTPVTGSGLYHVGLATKDQEMRLNLLENGAGPTRFDSGSVPWKPPLRRIDIDLAMNGFACNDRVYSIHAKGHSSASAALLAQPEPYNPGVTPSQ